jgi:phosphatidylethanolamine/phosphatidyl-N-methylethanolamine N-methyltransferase
MLLHEFIKNPQSIGSVLSSSPQLGKRMASYIDTAADGWVIEFGGGTGSITHEILQRGVSDRQLLVFEKSQAMACRLQRRFPSLTIVPEDAARISFVRLGGFKIKAIVSSLPLRSLPQKEVLRIVQASTEMLNVGAKVIQFTYLFRSASPWLDAGMQKVSSEIVWGNFPPAKIEVFQK